jgi:hypothetical protein
MKRTRVVIATVMALAATMISTGLPAAPAGASTCQGRVLVNDAGDSGLPGQLRQAIAQVCPGGTVQLRVAEPIVLVGEPVQVDQAVRVMGGGATIDGRAGAFDVAATGALGLVGLTLTNTTDDPATGIEVQGGAATLDGVTVTGFNRHGIRMSAGSVVVVGGSSAITGNVIPAGIPLPPSGSSTPHGAGISNRGGSITLKDTATVSDNTVFANSPGYFLGNLIPPFADGGGIFLSGGSLTMQDDASVTGNAAVPRPGMADRTGGGGILLRDASIDGVEQRATVVLEGRASITGNSAKRGAGIMNYDSDVILRDESTVTGNTAGVAGGGIWTYSNRTDAPATVRLHDRATVTGNTAPPGTGGGIHHGLLFDDVGFVVLRDDATVSGNTLPDIFGGTVLP